MVCKSRRIFAAFIGLSVWLTSLAFGQSPIAPTDQVVLEAITPQSLQGHLSFIASDLLEGRGTPSRGLDLAAEYIAAQFRRAGLEPVGDDGYFQTANWVTTKANTDGFSLVVRRGKQLIRLNPEQISFAVDDAISIQRAAFIKVDYSNTKALDQLTAKQVTGKVIVTEIPDFRRAERAKWGEMFRAQNNFLNKARTLQPALIISINRHETKGQGLESNRLIDPETRNNGMGPRNPNQYLTIHDPKFIRLFDALPPGVSTANLTFKKAAATEAPVKLKNVIGILRGSDPQLKDTYVLVTAHYDHIGIQPNCKAGDCINNGANDDGSGTVSVIELANALAKRSERPKRSIVFMTVFGEERGLLGSRYYGRHPIFPIEKTIADINLEQIGRTDDLEGSMLGKASMTGFDFSDIGTIFAQAGEQTGIKVFKHPQNSDAFFSRSDNQALADQGVPAHTLCVAFEYPDYHGLGDHWDKIDYDNFAKTNRMIALGLLMIAENPVAPKWNESNPKTAKYVEAWKKKQQLK